MLETSLKQSVPETVWSPFLERQKAFEKRNSSQRQKATDEKFLQLLRSTASGRPKGMPTTKEKALHNATSLAIPPQVELMLTLGPKFALPYHNIEETPFYHLLADVETIIKSSDDVQVQDRTRCAVANKLQNYVHRKRDSTGMDPNSKLFEQAEKKTRRFFKEHLDVIAVNADKGNKTVLMYRTEYSSKMAQLLNTDRTYKKVDKDPTLMFQTKNNNIVRRLLDLKLLDFRMAAKLRTYKAVCPKIYGQPKAHKPGLPLRPVVPCMTSPAYELSKYIGSILRKALTSKYNIKDSFEFCRFVNEIQIPQGHILLSFDVVSLFTSIPKELVKNSVFRHWNSIKQHTPICLDIFWEITEFCIDCSFFSFEGVYYVQQFGTAMGNPLSPVIADYVMEDLLEEATSRTCGAIPYLKKFVDDLFLTLPPEKVQEVIDVFNGISTDIQFTAELEVERRLPFLDMMLVRQENQTIKTEWYSKSIASGRFLNYCSNHPMHQKISIAKNFAGRVTEFSTNLDQRTVKTIITRHLKANDYPKGLINKVINHANPLTQHNTAMDVSRNERESQQNDTKFYSLTNIEGLTQQISKTLTKEIPGIKIYKHISL